MQPGNLIEAIQPAQGWPVNSEYQILGKYSDRGELISRGTLGVFICFDPYLNSVQSNIIVLINGKLYLTTRNQFDVIKEEKSKGEVTETR